MPSNTSIQPDNKTIGNTTGKTAPLAHTFAGNDGGAYYVTEVDAKVYWFAEHPGRDYAHVFHGTRDGDIIKGRFHSVPKDSATTQGQVTLKVLANGSLERVNETGGFPSKSMVAVSIDAITGKLPGKRKWPGFTANTIDDLDGVFDDGKGHRYYVREAGDRVVFFAEQDFKKGERPALALVFVGERLGSVVKGDWIAVPKGKKTGSGPLVLTVKSDRSVAVGKGSPLGEAFLDGLLPDITVPIAKVMELASTQLGKVKIRLDGYGGSKEPLKDGCFVQLGGKVVKFTMPSFDGVATRYFINDMESDIIHAKPVSENETRLSVIFEEKGREIKRVGKRKGWDDVARDWDLEDARCDVYIKLVNRKTTDGKPSVSYEVTKVDLMAEINAPGLIEPIDDWITGKVRPRVEDAVMDILNEASFRQLVADELRRRLDDLVKAASEYGLFGYLLAMLVPKQILIEGNNVVFRFH